MILILGQKLPMSWPLVKWVDHLTLATLVVTEKNICKADVRENLLLDRQEVC